MQQQTSLLNSAPQPCWKNSNHNPNLQSVEAGDSSRLRVERFIDESYSDHFGAKLKDYLPTLVFGENENQNIHIAFGIMPAVNGALFLENYLDQPIEDMLSNVVGTSIRRESIVEIGNISFENCYDLKSNLNSVATYCANQGFEYVVCTATRVLRIIFRRAGANPIDLAPAQHHQAPDNGTEWGDYYRFTPRVVAGNLLESLTQLNHGNN